MSALLPYLRLKSAQALLQCAPEHLSPVQAQQVESRARQELDLLQRVLATPEAAALHLPPEQVSAACAEIRQRYASVAEWQAALFAQGMSEDDLKQALACELRVAAVLQQLAEAISPPDDDTVMRYYTRHLAQFQRVESRGVRHILITIQEELADNQRPTALLRAQALAAQLHATPARFAELAMQHSECPTALEGGWLGHVPRGQLFPELDVVLFEMKAGEISAPVESPLGFHLLYCTRIQPAGPAPLEEVAPRLRQQLQQYRQRQHQQRWLARL